ncbi:unnamed protein product, partial [Heterotrigona itama]
VARFESRVKPSDMSIPMATISNGNGSTIQINTRPDDIQNRIIGAEDNVETNSNTCKNILVILSWLMVILTMPFSLLVCFKVLTKDSVTVSVDAVVYYRVNNATISITNVENAHHSTKLLAQTTLRNTMGTRPLHEILSERETISGNMQVIAAEGEQKASRALREASEVIGDSPAALQLRYLQTLNTISAEKNSTIVFPLPIDMLTYFLKAGSAKDS